MHASEVTQETIERANELYWASSHSVNQIADTLELSKGALYGAIEPLPSGHGCPLCGGEAAYPNRTAKERGILHCTGCDWDGRPDETVEIDPSAALDAREAPDGRAGGGGAGRKGHDGGGRRGRDGAGRRGRDDAGLEAAEATLPRPRRHTPTSTIAGGALLGAAAGLALVMWARRR